MRKGIDYYDVIELLDKRTGESHKGGFRIFTIDDGRKVTEFEAFLCSKHCGQFIFYEKSQLSSRLKKQALHKKSKSCTISQTKSASSKKRVLVRRRLLYRAGADRLM